MQVNSITTNNTSFQGKLFSRAHNYRPNRLIRSKSFKAPKKECVYVFPDGTISKGWAARLDYFEEAVGNAILRFFTGVK